jgi:hypothetical protein
MLEGQRHYDENNEPHSELEAPVLETLATFSSPDNRVVTLHGVRWDSSAIQRSSIHDKGKISVFATISGYHLASYQFTEGRAPTADHSGLAV